MTDRVPGWFIAAAVIATLFELIGVSGFVFDILRTPQDIAKLPVDQQLLWARTPRWLYGVYALAVFSGLLGTIGLLMRRAWSVPLLGLSLLTVLVQFSSY